MSVKIIEQLSAKFQEKILFFTNTVQTLDNIAAPDSKDVLFAIVTLSKTAI